MLQQLAITSGKSSQLNHYLYVLLRNVTTSLVAVNITLRHPCSLRAEDLPMPLHVKVFLNAKQDIHQVVDTAVLVSLKVFCFNLVMEAAQCKGCSKDHTSE